MLGRICEEFPLLASPAAAWEAWQEAPAGLIEEIIEARGYAATKAAMDRAPDRKSQPTGRTADLVHEIEFMLAEEALGAGQPDH